MHTYASTRCESCSSWRCVSDLPCVLFVWQELYQKLALFASYLAQLDPDPVTDEERLESSKSRSEETDEFPTAAVDGEEFTETGERVDGADAAENFAGGKLRFRLRLKLSHGSITLYHRQRGISCPLMALSQRELRGQLLLLQNGNKVLDYEVGDWQIQDLEPTTRWPHILTFDREISKCEPITSNIPGCEGEPRIVKMHLEQVES